MRFLSMRGRKIVSVAVVLLGLITMAFTAGGGFPSNPFFPTGAVLDFGGGDVTLTHAAATLTLAGGQFVFPLGSQALPPITGAGITSSGIQFTAAPNIRFIISDTLEAYVLTGSFAVINTLTLGSAADLILLREASAVLKFGGDAAAPITQLIKAGDGRAGTDTNSPGGIFRVAGGRPTGTGLPGLAGFQGSLLSTTSGTAASALVDRFIANAAKVLTNNSAVAVVNATVANGTSVGGKITYTIEVWNGTDNQVETGEAIYSVLNKAGTVAGTITEVSSQQNVNSGTLGTTWAVSAANPAVISINANSSLTPSTGYPRITFSLQNLGQQVVAIQ